MQKIMAMSIIAAANDDLTGRVRPDVDLADWPGLFDALFRHAS